MQKERLTKEQGYGLADHDERKVAVDSWAAHANLEMVLRAAGSSGEQILRQHIWQRDKRFFPCYERVRVRFQATPAPSSGLDHGAHGCNVLHRAAAVTESRCEESVAKRVLGSRICGGWSFYEIRTKTFRPIPPVRHLRGQHSQRSEAR